MSFLVIVFPFHPGQVIRTLQQAIPECSPNQALAYANTVDREVREKYYGKIMERELPAYQEIKYQAIHSLYTFFATLNTEY